MDMYRCMDEDCLWVGVNPEQLSDATGQYFIAICPVCDDCAELIDEATPTPPQGQPGLN
jgi:hypothetical protein